MKSISLRFGKKKISLLFYVYLFLIPALKAEEPIKYGQFSIFDLAPFDRAVCCIRYYEGMHRKEHYPYVGYGHKLKPGEEFSYDMTKEDAEILLRKDLMKYCSMFRSYGKDSLLLGALAYNVGPYTLLGDKKAGIEGIWVFGSNMSKGAAINWYRWSAKMDKHHATRWEENGKKVDEQHYIHIDITTTTKDNKITAVKVIKYDVTPQTTAKGKTTVLLDEKRK